MKACTVFAVITFAIVATLLATGEASNSTWGYVGRYDRVLLRQQLVVSSSFLRVIERDISFPAKGHQNYYNITAIKAIDHKRKDGGHAYLYRGGPGYRNATVHFKSDRGHGLNYTLEIFGH